MVACPLARVTLSRLVGRAIRASVLCVVAAGGPLVASAQSFINLDFDAARVPALEPFETAFLSWEQAAPGWSHSDGDDTGFVSYPSHHIGFSQFYVLVGTPGSFAMGMRSGLFRQPRPDSPSSDYVKAFLSQTGRVPDEAGLISLSAVEVDENGSPLGLEPDFAVLLDGQAIAMRPVLSDLELPARWVGDVSTFAGRVVELKIVHTQPRENFLEGFLVVDDIRFLPIPEPSTAALLGMGILWLAVALPGRRRSDRCSVRY
jgi:hypothetical protein